MYWKYLKIIEKEISGSKAWNYSRSIHNYDKFFSFKHMKKSACYVARKLKEVGCQEVEILKCPADGRTIIGDYIMDQAWDAEEGFLELIYPNGKRERIADYKKIPQNLQMYSPPTPPQGIVTEDSLC